MALIFTRNLRIYREKATALIDIVLTNPEKIRTFTYWAAALLAGLCVSINEIGIAIVSLGYSGVIYQHGRKFRFLSAYRLADFSRPIFRFAFIVWPWMLLQVLEPSNNSHIDEKHLILVVTLCVVIFWTRRRELSLTLHPNVLSLYTSMSIRKKLRSVVAYSGSAVVQELFYQGALLKVLSAFLGAWAIPISSFLFVLEHALQPKAATRYNYSDFAYHGMIAIISGSLYMLFESITLCIIFHVIFNLPKVLADFFRGSQLMQKLSTSHEM